ncbi:MAG: signal recognition particle protein, partial [Candidatus Gastranaerophilaceae bacterium]
RPAAISQLQTLGKQTSIAVFTIEGSTDVRNIVTSGLEYARNNGHNTVILDTAGRLQIDTQMMAELLIIDRLVNPQEKLLVVDAMTGQEAVNVAQMFDEQLGITGIILTKLDGDARGGAALSVVHSTGKPVKFTGTGEKLDALEPFYPERMAQRILGMGDIVSLVEKAQETFDVKQAKELEKKMMSKEFSFEDYLKIQKQMKMIGSLDQILGMLPIPGLDKNTKEMIANTGEKQMKKIEAMISSMTVQERKKPEILNGARRLRIAKGCGLEVQELNRFVKEFENMKKMMKKMTQLTQTMKKNPHMMKSSLNAMKGKFPKF